MSQPKAAPTSLIHIVRRGSVAAVLEGLAREQKKGDSRSAVTVFLDRCGVSATAEDENGQTALHYLVQGDSIESVEVLLQQGSVLDHADRLMKHTPLFYAARYGSVCMLRRLGELKANANLRDSNGQTPLFWTTRLENCRALVEHCHAHVNVPDAQSLGVADFFKKQVKGKHASRIAGYLAVCGEIRQLKHRHTWAVWEDVADLTSPGSSSSGFWAYATAMARQPDVQQLHELENDFVRDHQAMFGSAVASAEDMFQQVGLHPDADARRATIRRIAQPHATAGKVRHYTLKCVHIGPPSDTPPPAAVRTRGNPSAVRASQIIGYVYFRLCDGPYQPDAEEGSSQGRTSPGQGYMVVSHLKVDIRHQKRGVGTLLLAGALHVANSEKPGFLCKDVYLSVVAQNTAASRLYEKLGFTEWGRESGAVEWHKLHLPLAGTAPTEQAARWLAHVPGGSFGPLEKMSAAELRRVAAREVEFSPRSPDKRPAAKRLRAVTSEAELP